jgi:hypothetical protein
VKFSVSSDKSGRKKAENVTLLIMLDVRVYTLTVKPTQQLYVEIPNLEISLSELNVRTDTGCRVIKLRIDVHIPSLKSTTRNRLCVTYKSTLILPVLGTTVFWLRYFDDNYSTFCLMHTS